MRYFKYRSNVVDSDGSYRDIATLLNNELYASPFCALNDPFEATYNDLISSTLKSIQSLTNVNAENVTNEWDKLRSFCKKLVYILLSGHQVYRMMS